MSTEFQKLFDNHPSNPANVHHLFIRTSKNKDGTLAFMLSPCFFSFPHNAWYLFDSKEERLAFANKHYKGLPFEKA